MASSSKTVRTPKGTTAEISTIAREWLHYEASGIRLRMAHRCVEWDGWEEGLVESILGPEEFEDDWFRDSFETNLSSVEVDILPDGPLKRVAGEGIHSQKVSSKLPFTKELVKERVLNTTGDICGGRGGELGRRLEAWLTTTGSVVSHGDHPVTPVEGPGRRWTHAEPDHEIEVI